MLCVSCATDGIATLPHVHVDKKVPVDAEGITTGLWPSLDPRILKALGCKVAKDVLRLFNI